MVAVTAPRKPKEPPPEGRAWVRCPVCKEWRHVDALSARNNGRLYRVNGVRCAPCARRLGGTPDRKRNRDAQKLAAIPRREEKLPDAPTQARPGSIQKEQIMAARYAAGRHIYHPEDANCLPEGLLMTWLTAVVEVNRQIAERSHNGHSTPHETVPDAED